MVVQDADGLLTGVPGWYEFRHPVACFAAVVLADVRAVLQQAEDAAQAGRYVVGFLTYEAAPAFDPALATRAPGSLPFAWFGSYAAVNHIADPTTCSSAPFPLPSWRTPLSAETYAANIARIREHIARGDTYQVNYTVRLATEFTGDPWALFIAVSCAQRARYGAYFDFGRQIILSASPELFFTRRGSTLTCRPMKGTIGRGLSAQEDHAQAAALSTSAKNRAENVMIVDMVRNDLGRIARPGTVEVTRLFDLECYPTLWQMTSTVTAGSTASLCDVMGALFPCASITGAPKIRTSQLIAELETTPRGIYTGCLGFLTPTGDAQFNVAIRTALLDRQTGKLEYGTGGGITWDSDSTDEYQECLTKARVLSYHRPAFQLLETLLWKPESGYHLLPEHLSRLRESARYFGIPFDQTGIADALSTLVSTAPAQRQRVRLLLAEDGHWQTEMQEMLAAPRRRWRLLLAEHPIDPNECLLYHKTTWRDPYERARASAPEADDVVLWNPDGDITETTIANVVVRLSGVLYTPPVSAGLLPGVFRAHLLAHGCIAERRITRAELAQADAVYLINSVRGWIRAACW